MDNQWHTYDPAKPPGDDDWPIWIRHKNPVGETVILDEHHVPWRIKGNVEAWCRAISSPPTYTPPEPDLPKLYLGGEEIQFEEQINGWRVSSDGNVYLDNLDNYPTRAEAHAAVVELLESLRVVDNKLFNPFTFSQSEVDALVVGEALEKYNLRDAIDAILRSPPSVSENQAEDDELLPPCRVCGEPAQFLPELERMQCWKCKVIFAGPAREAKWRKLMGADPEDLRRVFQEPVYQHQIKELRKRLASAERVTDNMAQHRPDTLSGKLAIQHRAKYPKENL